MRQDASARILRTELHGVPALSLNQQRQVAGLDELRTAAGEQPVGVEWLDLDDLPSGPHRSKCHQRASDQHIDGTPKHGHVTEVATAAAAGVIMPTSIDRKATMPSTEF